MTHEVATSPPVVSANVLESALRAASADVAVFPLVPGKKIPATGNGFKSASTNPSQIKNWFTRNQNANIGIATGPVSRVWVLDIDVKDGALGKESFAELEHQHGQLPATRKCVTASGGYHLYFKYPADGKVGNRAAVRPGIDVRGDGGYGVAPPSMVNGKPYYWVNESEDIAEAPVWLLKLVRAPTRECGGYASETRMESYRGQVYIDVPYDVDDPAYLHLEAYLENGDGTMRWEGVRFSCYPLDYCMKNAHHDAPGYWDRWASVF